MLFEVSVKKMKEKQVEETQKKIFVNEVPKFTLIAYFISFSNGEINERYVVLSKIGFSKFTS